MVSTTAAVVVAAAPSHSGIERVAEVRFAAGWLWFGEKPTLSLALGAVVVVSTTVLASPAERWLRARRKDDSRA